MTISLSGRGARGESQADILRRTGQFGVLPTDTDAEAVGKLNADAAASAAAAAASAAAAAASAALATEHTSFLTLAAAGSTAPAIDTMVLVNINSSTIASHTVTLPLGASDGQVFRIETRGAITALTITPPSGQTVANAPTTAAANSAMVFRYRAAGLSWHYAGNA